LLTRCPNTKRSRGREKRSRRRIAFRRAAMK
jgi:hypothetical protein